MLTLLIGARLVVAMLLHLILCILQETFRDIVRSRWRDSCPIGVELHTTPVSLGRVSVKR
jgi:hypothetical protein